MLLADRLREMIDAAFTGLWIHTAEPDEAIREIKQLAAREGYKMLVAEPLPGEFQSPYAPFAELKGIESAGPALLLLPNYHTFIQNDPLAKQACYRAIMAGKTAQRFVIILSPIIAIPAELEKVFVVIDHELPTRSDLNTIAHEIGTGAEIPAGPELELLLDAAAGLTRYEAEGAFSLSIVRHGKISPQTVWEHKEGALKKAGLLTLYRGEETFNKIGGLEPLKEYLTASLDPAAPFSGQGVMLVGVPGTGKSTIAKALAKQTGRPCLVLDIGALMSKYVGDSEHNIKRALDIADAMAPCILFLDEIEKALAGAGTESSGTTTKILGALLTWLNDHKTAVYVIGTSNRLKDLPSALIRSGRIDATWFLDYPDQAQRATIWPLYLEAYGLDPDQARPQDDRWTGAEIRHCCKEAAQKRRPIIEAARYVIPVSVAGSAENESLRSEAAGKYLDANTGDVFGLRPTGKTADAGRRTVKRRSDLE